MKMTAWQLSNRIGWVRIFLTVFAACGLFLGLSLADEITLDSNNNDVAAKQLVRVRPTSESECRLAGGRSLTPKAIQNLKNNAPCELNSFPKISGKIDAQKCLVQDLEAMVIFFRSSHKPLFAEVINISPQSIFSAHLYRPWIQFYGPSREVSEIYHLKVCRKLNDDVSQIPQTYCSEPRQVAINFNYNTPFNNKIMTNGFSFYLEAVGNVPPGFSLDEFGQQVRDGFQKSILIWTSKLSEKNSAMPKKVVEFVTGRTSKSKEGMQLFVPPQVIQQICPQPATFRVQVHFERNKFFPSYPLTLARSQIEGRTIALNLFDFHCMKSDFVFDAKKRLTFDLANNCKNLIPILTHELGHAFGLNHLDKAGHHSVMDSTLSLDALTPTDTDAFNLAGILMKSINGAVPGKLEFITSEGVMPPIGKVNH